MNTREYVIPDFYLPPLINGDYSGLEESDITALDSWIDTELKTCDYFHVLCDTEDMGFMRFHDLAPYGILASDCYRVLVNVGKETAQ